MRRFFIRAAAPCAASRRVDTGAAVPSLSCVGSSRYNRHMRALIDFFLHIDTHLAALIAQYGMLTYAILFAIIFVETGVVIMPLLPGDSLLFAAGTFAASGAFSLPALLVLLFAAAVVGDAINYSIGRRFGSRVVASGRMLGVPVKREYFDRTSRFFSKYGNKAIVFARFMPIIRTFAPFMAGVGGMDYRRFAIYNLTGGALWVTSFTLAGYFFGNIPAVRDNFTHVIMAIIVLSVIPPAVETLRAHRENGGKGADKNNAG